jgi:hypothetical protein
MIRLAVLLVAITSAACGAEAVKYNVMKVDSKVAPWKPADPDDLVVEDEDDDDDDADKEEAEE